MVGVFTCQLFVKMFCLFADHRIWQETGEPEAPPEGEDSWRLHRQQDRIRTAICPKIRPNVRTKINCLHIEVVRIFVQ